MKSEDIKNKQWSEHERKILRRISARQAAGDDAHTDYSEIPRLSEKKLRALVSLRERRAKVPVSVRLNPEVIDWLKSKGRGHLTRINDILENLMEAERHSA